MATDLPPPPKSPMAEMRPAPAQAKDPVYRKGEYADLQRSNQLQMDFERGEARRRESDSKAPARESTFGRIVKGYKTIRSMKGQR